ncbi:hypothetical protein KSP39_PZI024318 [Platanthera zijinensis]|uniref:Transcription repressor n=1 Tax=Platanthera zijinensis TaxID=2320716 RepID=A0AAP0ATD7_9ASPA
MENKPRLKDRLARIFWPPSLLRASAAVSSRSHSAAISSRSLSAAASTRSFSLAGDIAQEPLFIPRLRRSEAEEVNLSLLRRSFSLDRRSRRNFVGCGGCRPHSAAPPPAQRKVSKVRESRGFYDSVDRGEGDGRTCPPASPSSHSPENAQLYYYCFKEEKPETKRKKKKKMVKQKQRTRSNRHELSISSSFDEEGFGLFSSEEAETFFSTKSFSSDSSEFYSRPSSKTRKTAKKTEQINRKKKLQEKSISSSHRRQPRRRAARSRDDFGNGFQPLVSVSFSEEDEVEKRQSRHEGFPVLKKSSDPYSDFRSSMAEMIVERQIFGTRELDRLLHSYLSLNSLENHPAILRAFSDISQVLFSY